MIQSTDKVLKIVGVYFVNSVGIEEIEESGQLVSISLYDGYTWEEIKFSEAVYNEPASETDQGILYNQQLELVMAGDDATIQARLKELETAKPVVRFEYDNGTSKVIGDKENWCKVFNSGSSEGFVTKNDVTITRSSSCKAFFLSE